MRVEWDVADLVDDQQPYPPSARELRAILPLVELDTRRPMRDEPKVGGSVRIVDNGGGRHNRIRDWPVFRDRIGIELRGYSSQWFPKRHTRSSCAAATLPADDDWVLAAPHADKSLMRNVLPYHTARSIGRHARAPGSSSRS